MTHEGYTPGCLFNQPNPYVRWLDFEDKSTWFKDHDCTIPAEKMEDVRYIKDKSGNGNHLDISGRDFDGESVSA